MKLFDRLALEEDTTVTTGSAADTDAIDVVEVIEADIIEKQAEDEHNELEDGIKTLDQLTDVEQELTESIIKDEVIEGRTVEQSMEELFVICDKYGLPCKLASTFGTEAFDASTLSLEAILEEKKGLMEKVKKAGKLTLAAHKEALSSFIDLFSLLSKYKADKLRALKTKIESDELVPRKEIDAKANANFNNKLGVFHAFGYTATGKTSDLIRYLKMPLDNVNSDFYTSYISYANENLLVAKTNETNLPKHKESSDFIAKLKDVNFAIDPKSEQFKLGFLISYFGKTVSLMSVTQDSDKGADIHADIIKVKEVEDIKPASKQDIIKLLDFGINNESDIQKAASSIKSRILPNIGKGVNNALSTVGWGALVGPLAIKRYARNMFLTQRLMDNLQRHVISTAKEISRYDSIIAEYVALTYERAEVKEDTKA